MSALGLESRATIMTGQRCVRCGASVWYVDGEWQCSLCSRPVQPAIVQLPPPSAEAAPVRAFLARRCQTDPDARIGVSQLYAGYLAWCAEGRRISLGRRAFTRALHALGYGRGRTAQGRYWEGFRWRAAHELPERLQAIPG